MASRSVVIMVIIYEDEITSAEVNIMFNYSVVIQNELGWLFTNFSYIENLMVSMERRVKYTEIKGENFEKK